MPKAFKIETGNNSSKFNEIYLQTIKHKGLKDPEKIEADLREKRQKFALSPITGEIIGAGFVDVGDIKMMPKSGISPMAEVDIIHWVWEQIHLLYNEYSEQEKCCIVTFNGKSFDFPYLITRSLINNIHVDKTLCDLLLNKNNDSFHLDLTKYFNEGTLNILSHLILDTDLDDITGKDVMLLLEKNNYKAIRSKNHKDLVKIADLYNMFH